MNGSTHDQYDVFLSHSSRDKPWVGEFADQLRAKGLKVFYDAVEIPKGGDFRKRIADALCGTKTKLLIFLTQHSIRSDWVYWEFTLVANPDPGNRQERVIFVYLEDVRHLLPPEMQYPSSPVLLFDTNARKQNWERLLGALGLEVDAAPMPSLEKLRESVAPQSLPQTPLPKLSIALHPPAPPEQFFGRIEELRQLDQTLLTEARQNAVVAVVGIGGQGKSTLVWRWLTTRQADIPHEVIFYSTAYRGGFSFLRFLEEALYHLGGGEVDLREIPRTDDRIACLSRLLAVRPILLLIDGIERWLRGWEKSDDPMAAIRHDDLQASEVSAGLDLFLQEAASLTNGTQLLLTTRALPQALKDCAVFRISTEATAARDRQLEGLEDGAAVALFRSLNVSGSDDVLRAAANEYGNHPLAVRALGSLLAEEYGGDIARRPDVRHLVEIEDKIAVLLRDLEERRPNDVPILQTASLCYDEAPLPAIVAGLGEEQMPRDTETRARLAALDRWGIVDFDGAGEGCVRLHPLIQRHFEATVAEPAPIHRRLSNYFSAVPVSKEASRLEDVRGRILAIKHSLAAGDVDRCCDLLFRKMNNWYTLSDWLNAWGHLEFGIDIKRRVAERANHKTRAELLVSIAVSESFLGRLDAALIDTDEAIEIYHMLFEKEQFHHLSDELALVLLDRGEINRRRGNLCAALDDLDAAINFYVHLTETEKRRDLRNNLAGAFQNRGCTYGEFGDFEAAISDFNRAISIRLELVQREGQTEIGNYLAKSFQNRALAYEALEDWTSASGDFTKAIELYEQLIDKDERCELYPDLAMIFQNRADVYQSRGDVESALRDYDRAIGIYRNLFEKSGRLEFRHDLARTLLNRSMARAKRDLMKALSEANEGLHLWRDLLAQGQRQHRGLYIHFLAITAQDVDIPFGQANVATSRVHEGLGVLETALSEPNGWNEVLGKEAENFFNWTGAVLDKLRAAGLDLDRYNRVREAASKASLRFDKTKPPD